MALTGTVEERQIDGNYGEIYHEGHYQGDIVSFTGRVAIERRTIQVAGSNRVVHRRGTISREGTFVINKVDTRFENKILSYAGYTTAERRAFRDAGIDPWPSTDFIIKIDDPDSWGAERIHIMGVKLWEIGLGFSPGEMINRDLPCTWHTEKILDSIGRPGNLQGATAHTGATAAGSDGNLVW